MPQAKKTPRPVSAQSLKNAALRYMERYATSSENLKNVLMRRVQKSHFLHGTDVEEGRIWVEEIVQNFQKAGILDDQGYADMRASSLHRRGQSTRMIRMKLKEKGLSEEVITKALDHVRRENDGDNLEQAAARKLAKRRRLGPYRDPAKRAEFKEKDMAALARAGFSYDIARAIIDADDIIDWD